MFWRTSISSLVWICFCSAGANAQWIRRSSQSEPSPAEGVIHQHIVLNDSSGDDTTLDLAKFSSTTAHLRLIDNPERRDAGDALNARNNVAGINGGYFDPDFAPLGLRIVDGNTLSPLVRGRLLTGVIVCSRSKTQILRLSEFATRSRPATAIQCGPFLIDHGAAVAGLESTHMARRSFIAVAGSNDILVGYCPNASLAQLPLILIAAATGSKIERALNLDGGSSSAFWFKRRDGSIFSIPNEKTVRDFIAVTAER